MGMVKVFSIKCEYCGKEIKSLYKRQAESNLASHLISCKKKNEVKK